MFSHPSPLPLRGEREGLSVLKENDIIDAILEVLQARKPAPAADQATPRPNPSSAVPKRWKFVPDPTPKGRPFLTEHEIRKALTPDARRLTIPRNAIVSPLALDWLALKGIEIVRE